MSAVSERDQVARGGEKSFFFPPSRISYIYIFSRPLRVVLSLSRCFFPFLDGVVQIARMSQSTISGARWAAAQRLAESSNFVFLTNSSFGIFEKLPFSLFLPVPPLGLGSECAFPSPHFRLRALDNNYGSFLIQIRSMTECKELERQARSGRKLQ